MVTHENGGGHGHHQPPSGFIRKWIFSIDHKVIGIQYLLLALFSVFVGMALSLLMRLHLAWPTAKFAFFHGGQMTPEQYLALMTMHGTIMVFMVLTTAPQSGFGNYFLPIQIGAADMAFPVLNMLSFWTTFVSLIVMICAFFVSGGAPIGGWTSYPPLSALGEIVGPGQGAGETLWIVGLAIFCGASLMGALNFITTLIDLRAKGMTLGRLPLTCWTWFVTAILGLAGVRRSARGVHPAPARSPRWHQLLYSRRARGHRSSDHLAQGRFAASVAAPVLVLRPSRGVHRHSSRNGRGVALALHVRAQAGLRLPRDGRRGLRHRLPRLLRVGPSHVRQRHEPVLGVRLFDPHHDHRRAVRDQDVQLAGNPVGRQDPIQLARCCLPWASCRCS